MDTFYTGRFILFFILYDSMHLQPLAYNHKLHGMDNVYVLSKKQLTRKEGREMAEIIIRNMPRELRQELKIQAALEGRSMTAIIIGLIIAYLQEKRKETER